MNTTFSDRQFTTTITHATLIEQTHKSICYDKYVNQICGYDGTHNYIHKHLMATSTSISMATALSHLTFVITPFFVKQKQHLLSSQTWQLVEQLV